MPSKRQVLDQLKRNELIAAVEQFELPVAEQIDIIATCFAIPSYGKLLAKREAAMELSGHKSDGLHLAVHPGERGRNGRGPDRPVGVGLGGRLMNDSFYHALNIRATSI